MDKCCGFAVIIFIVVVVGMIISAISDAKKDKIEQEAHERALLAQQEEERRKEKEREAKQEKIRRDQLAGKIMSHTSEFSVDVRYYFSRKWCNYNEIYQKLMEHINEIKITSRRLPVGTNRKLVTELTEKANAFETFAKRINGTNVFTMFTASNYGIINKEHWSKILQMDIQQADEVMSMYSKWIKNLEYDKFSEIDINLIWESVWIYATHRPYSAQKLHNAQDLFYSVYKKGVPDIEIAELYAINQFGAKDVLSEQVRSIIKGTQFSPFLTTVASGLMWMGAYNEENEILSHILKSGQPMSEKAQERLHTLSTGGGKAPAAHEVDVNEGNLYFDVSSLAWKDDEYEGLFSNLAFRGTEMSYSLAVRDQNTNVSITSGYPAPTLEGMLAKFKSSFLEEYDDIVTAKIKNCVALSGNSKEQMQCIQVKSKECEQMRILVHITRIGKNLNIKLYTLFSPVGNEIANQKQQALSLYHELSPSVKGWEDSMKNTILRSIQQLLNQPHNTNPVNQSNDDDGTVF